MYGDVVPYTTFIIGVEGAEAVVGEGVENFVQPQYDEKGAVFAQVGG